MVQNGNENSKIEIRDILTDRDDSMNNMISNKNCSLGDSDHLVIRLKEALDRAVRIDLLVAFLMESGVRLIEEDLRKAVEKGIPVRILTGNYLNITEPSALYL